MSRTPRPFRSAVQKIKRRQRQQQNLVELHDVHGVTPALNQLAATLGPNTPGLSTPSVNKRHQTLNTITPDQPDYPLAKKAANTMATNANLRARYAKILAQKAWLDDILHGPEGGSQGGQRRVMGHLREMRQQKEAHSVLSTLGTIADMGPWSGSDLSFVKSGNTIEGMMSSMGVNQGNHSDRGVGFLSTKPGNISGPGQSTPGVGTAIVDHANALGLRQGARFVTLGAEGKEAQGFYRHVGFEKADGNPLQPADFTNHSIDLRKRVR
ncbi:MAG: GNAT family N-acetyltransferase [Pseudomonadota bacterium]|uniref:GNAT family N-acetyltransferase n=1 Tax=Gallaecimonas pentaromativorans TaxID=584787 RepID=UPI00067F18C1|nr:GNAT family N-acetyltransferase [Gallaecimonas pentaromativorans]MED5523358.1 GNAT family N-acetyltransferase [Pseudomonadota bacterium]